MRAGERFVKAIEEARVRRDMIRTFGDPAEWVVSVEEILDVMERGTCRHGRVSIEDCSECMTRELCRRQIRILAERLGCDPETAVAAADKSIAEQDARGEFSR